MANEANEAGRKDLTIKHEDSLLIDEFDIIELEDRLELDDRCNGRCDGS